MFISLVKDGKTIKYTLEKNLVKKADALPQAFLDTLNGVKTNQITDFYITIGPGSFTGARTGLVFARSICQITKANLHTTTSPQLIAGPHGEKEIFIDARSKMSYFASVNNGLLNQEITLVPFQESTKQDYDELIKNPVDFFKIFKLEENILSVHPQYIKTAKIG
ncbi:hypothetical protein C4B24_03780 [Mycoplasma marinum]|uniref:Gcp-like domain-containing protein n=2 Tax=Mycoplasma marinum TaxID=1937190 RepID=A0A4R0XMX1_9MOLU|nr:hypothetical protein C4B24_03780 [Mycoplasma marinum]